MLFCRSLCGKLPEENPHQSDNQHPSPGSANKICHVFSDLKSPDTKDSHRPHVCGSGENLQGLFARLVQDWQIWWPFWDLRDLKPFSVVVYKVCQYQHVLPHSI